MPIREQLILEGVNNTQTSFNQVQKSLGRLDKGFGAIQKTILSVAAALGSISVGRNIIQTVARFEDLRTTLTSVTGSAREGAKAFEFVSKFSTKTQFGVEELTETYIKLKSNGIEPSTELLTTFTDAAAVTTDQIGSLTALTDFYTRSLQSQKVELTDLNRLSDRGLPVYDILKEKLGVARGELSKFSGEAGNTQKIIDALGEGINERFGGATAARIQNLSTRMSNFSIALKNSADVMGQQFSAALGTGIEEFTKFIESNDDMIRNMGDSLVKLSVNVLLGTGRILDALAPIFKFVKQGINGLVRFVNQLPPEFQILGMIGFFLVGRGVKLILLAVAALFDEIKGAMD
jgi:tape measure domain-containing protein